MSVFRVLFTLKSIVRCWMHGNIAHDSASIVNTVVCSILVQMFFSYAKRVDAENYLGFQSLPNLMIETQSMVHWYKTSKNGAQ